MTWILSVSASIIWKCAFLIHLTQNDLGSLTEEIIHVALSYLAKAVALTVYQRGITTMRSWVQPYGHSGLSHRAEVSRQADRRTFWGSSKRGESWAGDMHPVNGGLGTELHLQCLLLDTLLKLENVFCIGLDEIEENRKSNY